MRPAPEQVLEALGSAGALCHLLAAKAPDLQPELAGHAGAPVRGFESIDQARDGDLTFVRSPDYAARWADSKATVVLVTRGVELEPGDGRAVITVASADAAVATLLGMLAEHAPSEPAPQGKHPTAAVHETATVPESASIGAHATIGPGATLGERTQVHSGATVGAGVVVGHDCVVHPGARLLPGTRIGDRTQILANAVIGADGFGFTTHPATGVPIRIPHLAGVSIGSDCEIGAGSCVDRGKLRDTTIGDHTKLDNLVQIGHTCTVGSRVRICGCTAIGGSTVVGDDALLGGAVCIPDNVTIAPKAILGGGAMVTGNVRAGEPWMGFPARPWSRNKRIHAATLRLDSMRTTLLDLVKRVKKLES